MYFNLLATNPADALVYGLSATCCAVIIVIAVAITFLCVILWRMSSRKTVVVKSEVKESGKSDRRCPDCGRVIPFDAKICPYCKKDFEE